MASRRTGCRFRRSRCERRTVETKPQTAGSAGAVSEESRTREVVTRAALLAEYDRACVRYRLVSQKIEEAEDERDEIRRECERLERELGL